MKLAFNQFSMQIRFRHLIMMGRLTSNWPFGSSAMTAVASFSNQTKAAERRQKTALSCKNSLDLKKKLKQQQQKLSTNIHLVVFLPLLFKLLQSIVKCTTTLARRQLPTRPVTSVWFRLLRSSETLQWRSFNEGKYKT